MATDDLTFPMETRIDPQVAADGEYKLISNANCADFASDRNVDTFIGTFDSSPKAMLDNKELSEEEDSYTTRFKVDITRIQSVAIDEQAEEIQSLGLTVYDQGTLERGILNQVEEETRRRDAQAQLAAVSTQLKHAEEHLKRVDVTKGVKRSFLRDALQQQKDEKEGPNSSLEAHKLLKEKEVQELRSKKATLKAKLFSTQQDTVNDDDKSESERERKIRMGEITPFGTSLNASSSDLSSFQNYLKRQNELHQKMLSTTKGKSMTLQSSFSGPNTKQTESKSILNTNILFPKKKKKKEDLGTRTSSDFEDVTKPVKPSACEKSSIDLDCSGSEYTPTESEYEDQEKDFDFALEDWKKTKGTPSKSKVHSHNRQPLSSPKKGKRKAEDRWSGGSIKRRRKPQKVLPDGDADDWNSDDSDWICTDDEYSSENESARKVKRRVKREMDDGNDEDYFRRVKQWERHNEGLRDQMEEECHELDNGFKIPLILWNKLFKYQQVGVRWLWELNMQRCGGILGDEMGLGKTIQIIAFLAGLSLSKLKCRSSGYRGLGPTLIVCPTTVMHQWVREFHVWFPPLRVAVLHESGCYTGKRTHLIREVVRARGILITSYTAIVRLKDHVVDQPWHYVILDEGHKIRNPDAKVTLVAKQLRTPHRLILSGSPMQNNLRELWSLLDFVFPGKLGTLPVFMQEFAVPITQGGYSNASEVMVATAFKCATVLRDTISPYLLRRMKSDVGDHIKLPAKNEQVLFCRLTDEQRQLYKGYLECGEVGRILEGRMQIFVGLINLRKICNHPHLYSGGPKLFAGDKEEDVPFEERFGYWNKAGKMIVIEALLKLWRRQEHRVLLFTQSRQMLLIMENFVNQQGYSYLKLDGGTSIAARQPLINKFNQDKSYFLMLLTTKVGGLGVNLTGANRIVIYDPDWNPATDTQARERAWRIGQKSAVTVYRLITAGTIEEKMYHRQIFKQFLCNKVLKDPRQRRFFKSNDLLELFTLKETDGDCTETAAIFAGTGSQVRVDQRIERAKESQVKRQSRMTSKGIKRLKHSVSATKSPTLETKISFSQDKLEHMKKLAHELSLKVAQKAVGNTSKQADTAKICDTSVDSEGLSVHEDYSTVSAKNTGNNISLQASSDEINTNISVLSKDLSMSDKGSLLVSHTHEKSMRNALTLDQISDQDSDNDIENMKKLAQELSKELSNKVQIAANLNKSRTENTIAEKSAAFCDENPSTVEPENPACQKGTTSKNEFTDLPACSSKSCSQSEYLCSKKESIDIPSACSSGESGNKAKLNPSRLCEPAELQFSDNRSKHHKKHKKHKKSKYRGRKGRSVLEFEGEKVPNLVGASSFPSKTEDNLKEEGAHSAKQDDYVLRKLFAKTGLQTAMQHDKVMESGHADFALVEGEARRVAQDAVKALKASRRNCWSATSGVPTWTGASGSLRTTEQTGDQPSTSRPKFGKKKIQAGVKNHEKPDETPSEEGGSSSLLARIRARNLLLEKEDETAPPAAVPDSNKDLLDDVRTFVSFGASVDGRATTDEIVARFRDRLPPQSSALFKQMLMQICEFHRLPSGQGVWKLIQEFQW